MESGRVLFFRLAKMCHRQHHGRQSLGLQSQRRGLNFKALHVVRSPCAKELYWDSTPPGLHCEAPLVFFMCIYITIRMYIYIYINIYV